MSKVRLPIKGSQPIEFNEVQRMKIERAYGQGKLSNHIWACITLATNALVIVSEMQKRKFRIVNETQSEMSFEQLAGSEVLKSLPETDIGKAPIERVTYTIKPIAGDIRVSSEIAVISKTGSSPEKKVDISQSAEAQTVQSVLDKIVGK